MCTTSEWAISMLLCRNYFPPTHYIQFAHANVMTCTSVCCLSAFFRENWLTIGYLNSIQTCIIMFLSLWGLLSYIHKEPFGKALGALVEYLSISEYLFYFIFLAELRLHNQFQTYRDLFGSSKNSQSPQVLIVVIHLHSQKLAIWII